MFNYISPSIHFRKEDETSGIFHCVCVCVLYKFSSQYLFLVPNTRFVAFALYCVAVNQPQERESCATFALLLGFHELQRRIHAFQDGTQIGHASILGAMFIFEFE